VAGGVSIYKYQVELLPRNTSDQRQILEVMNVSDTGAIHLALHKIGDLHGQKFYPGEVIKLEEV
jgi:hypothetical protein